MIEKMRGEGRQVKRKEKGKEDDKGEKEGKMIREKRREESKVCISRTPSPSPPPYLAHGRGNEGRRAAR